MLLASVDMIAADLRRYGEDDAAEWVMECSDEELVRICSVAHWLTLQGPTQEKSGNSMMIAKACALAAVYVREGAPRDLARKNRRPAPPLSAGERAALIRGRWPSRQGVEAASRHYGVGEDAKAYWSAR